MSLLKALQKTKKDWVVNATVEKDAPVDQKKDCVVNATVDKNAPVDHPGEFVAMRRPLQENSEVQCQAPE